MPAAYMNDSGDWVKACSVCKEVQPVAQYYKHTPGHSSDGYKPRCRTCTSAKFREQNARRAKKRRQKSHKLTKLHVDWIREQQGKLSTRATAKAFSKRFFNMKISSSTVSRIFSGKIHIDPDSRDDVLSIYDLLEGASEFSGSVEDYIESAADKKIKF
jgi:hypothetical protein